MDKKRLTVGLSAFVFALYIVIILYVLFAVLHIQTYTNFIEALIFQIIGFVLLAWCVFGSILSRSIKTGFLIPLITTTILYTILLNILNIWAVMIVSNVFFTLLHFILLLVYCLISIPMYIMGRI